MNIEIDPPSFLRMSLQEKLQLINQNLGHRLQSPKYAAIFHHLAGQMLRAGELDGVFRRRFFSETMQLAPYSAEADAWFDALFPAEPRAKGFVTLIVSCRKYLAKAESLHVALQDLLPNTLIVIGDPGLQEAALDGKLLTVPAADDYESLPFKMLESLYAVRSLFGAVGILKIDDDSQLTGPPVQADVQRITSTSDYAGQPIGHTMHDRCWHVGKCSNRLLDKPYTRRFIGPWARGASYYLSPRAVGIVLKDYLKFPDQIAGEIYEDKMIGDILRSNGITLSAVSMEAVFGLHNAALDPTLQPR